MQRNYLNISKKSLLGCMAVLAYGISNAVIPPIPAQFRPNMSVLVINDNSGRIVYSHKPDTPRLIASNMKLITTAIALQQLHTDFRWHTKLFYSGAISNGTLNGNVYIVGGGDPTFDSRALNEVLSQLKKLNVHKIKGNLIVDDTIFNSLPTYSMLRVENYDADTVLPHGLTIDADTTSFNIHVKHKQVSIDNNLYGYTVKNNLTVDNSLAYCPDLSKMVFMHDKAISFSGKIPASCNNTHLEFNMVPYKDYTSMAINRTLANLSIKLTGGVIFDNAPNKAYPLYDYKSQSLEDALIYMDHYSINLIAEAVLLSLGAYTTNNSNTYSDGKRVYTDYMQDVHISNPKFKLENGAGLSRKEYMTATNMAHLLSLMSRSTYRNDFENALPRSGESGTMGHTFTRFGDRVRFKTGTLNDTRAYSGYFYTKSGVRYIVVIFANNVDTNNDRVNKSLDGWISKLLKSLGR